MHGCVAETLTNQALQVGDRLSLRAHSFWHGPPRKATPVARYAVPYGRFASSVAADTMRTPCAPTSGKKRFALPVEGSTYLLRPIDADDGPWGVGSSPWRGFDLGTRSRAPSAL